MEEEEEEEEQGVNLFNGVPLDCIATILSFTTPTDASRFALLSKHFLSASDSDLLWERFLPSDYHLILARSHAEHALLANFNNKKQLYMHIADRPLFVDNNTQSFWLEKSSGKKCLMIGAESLSPKFVPLESRDRSIVRDWKWKSSSRSRFSKVGLIIGKLWFEIIGRIQTSMLSPGTQYAAYLVVNMSEDHSWFRHIDESQTLVCSIRVGGEIRSEIRAMENWSLYMPRKGRWRELKMGEFLTKPDPGEEDEVVEMLLMKRDGGGVKESHMLIIVDGIELRPA